MLKLKTLDAFFKIQGFITRLDPEANILGEGESNEQGVALSGLEPISVESIKNGVI